MSKLIIPGFHYSLEVVAPDGTVVDVGEVDNLIPQQGIDYVISALNGQGSVVGEWYLGVFANNYTPVPGSTAAILPTTIGEFTAYSEATRPAWVPQYDGLGRLRNDATLGEFTLTADATLYGAFLVSDASKGGGAGTLLSIARFPSPKELESGSTLRIRAGIEVVAG